MRSMNPHGKWAAAFLLLVASRLPAEESKIEPSQLKAAIARALPLLQKAAAGHVAQRTCFSCHHQALPVLALSLARERGFGIDEQGFRKQLKFTHAALADWAKRNPERKNFLGGQADTAGYALFTLDLGGWKADDTTRAVAAYLLRRNHDLDHWRNVSNRPPSEATPFTTTALALHGLVAYGAADQKEPIAMRVAAARAWLLRTKPRDNEDRVFRLWGLKYAQAKPEELRPAVAELLQAQTNDGGWTQTDTLKADAYATGSALVALRLAGGLPTSHAAYQRGLQFLLRSQRSDGSWFVKSRSRPFQTYFETGFPHGKDQWISAAASGWATAALALGVPPEKPGEKQAARKPVSSVGFSLRPDGFFERNPAMKPPP
jgi:hypothetical protein